MRATAIGKNASDIADVCDVNRLSLSCSKPGDPVMHQFRCRSFAVCIEIVNHIDLVGAAVA